MHSHKNGSVQSQKIGIDHENLILLYLKSINALD